MARGTPRGNSRGEGKERGHGFGGVKVNGRGPRLAFELELADMIAERVAARVEGTHQTPSQELIDAHEVARILGCKRSWVYEHKAELPLVRLGNGSRPRLRFDRAKVEAMVGLGRRDEHVAVTNARRARPRRGRSVPIRLLEIKGQAR